MIGHDDFQATKQDLKEAWDKTEPATEGAEDIQVTKIAIDHFGYDLGFLPPKEYDEIVLRYKDALAKTKSELELTCVVGAGIIAALCGTL
jgi:hypothetical protein